MRRLPREGSLASSQTHHRYIDIFAWLKSISGWLLLNFSKISCFFSSSLVGRPIAFCRWSYIIFSTVCRVSPSKSDKLLFSGWIFWRLILGSDRHTDSHHSMSFDFCSVKTRRLPSSIVQKESSTIIAFASASSTTGSVRPLRATFRRVLVMTTFRSRPRVFSGRGTNTDTSCKVWVQTYFPSTAPPFPTGGGESSSSSPPSPSPSSSGAADFVADSEGAGSSSCGSFDGGFASSSPAATDFPSAAGEPEMSNPPLGSSSITSSPAFDAFAFASFAFAAASFFFFFVAASSSFLRFSLKYISACFRSTAWTVSTAFSVPFSPLPGGPAKKSDFRRKKEKSESRRGSMPWVSFAIRTKRPSNRSSCAKSGRAGAMFGFRTCGMRRGGDGGRRRRKGSVAGSWSAGSAVGSFFSKRGGVDAEAAEEK
ncbi:hypothetical protein ACHAWF_007718 [Thalassiosira exigua]